MKCLPMIMLATLASSQASLSQAKPMIVFGKTEWKLTITADDDRMLEDLRPNTYIPWCFDALKGRGILKEFSLHLHWDADGLPHLALAKGEVRAHQEDGALIGCLDTSIRAYPPRHERGEDELRFLFIRSRK